MDCGFVVNWENYNFFFFLIFESERNENFCCLKYKIKPTLLNILKIYGNIKDKCSLSRLRPFIWTFFIFKQCFIREKIYSSQNYHKVVIKRLYYATNWTSTAKIPHDLIETLYHTTVCISSNTVFPLTKCVLLQSSIMVFFSFLRMNHFKKLRL